MAIAEAHAVCDLTMSHGGFIFVIQTPQTMSRDTRRQRRCVPIQRIFESIQVTDTRRQTRVNGPYYIQEQAKNPFFPFSSICRGGLVGRSTIPKSGERNPCRSDARR